MHHLLADGEYLQVRDIVRDTWEGVRLHKCEHDIQTGLLTCVYNEGRFFNEIAWAGQGLQIWLQLITHMVRLSGYPVLVFDEPEIYLHPKKQHDLLQLLQNYYMGCAIIATHSSELMNSVDISHIIYVQKDTQKAIIRKATDRNSLEKIRRNIGSSFNLYASQFEDVDLLVATEHQIDYDVIQILAQECGLSKKTQNIKLSGFSAWKDSVHFRDAYSLIFGKPIECSVLLDRDYYPQSYLDVIKATVGAKNVRVTFTPGKEIENLFLAEGFIVSLVPPGFSSQSLVNLLDTIYAREHEPCKTKYA
jgi:hypothetical protein